MFWKKKPMLPEAVQESVVAAIRQAEAHTTGEIRVFVEHHCNYMDALDRAAELFTSLGMVQTEMRNAVLIYLAITDKQFALYGDAAVYSKVGGAGFWQQAADLLQNGLRNRAIDDGLVACITALGQAMTLHFPYDSEVEKNELPDEIVFGK